MLGNIRIYIYYHFSTLTWLKWLESFLLGDKDFFIPVSGTQGWDMGCLMRDKNIDELMQERRNSIANALELRLSCTNPLIWWKFSSYIAVLFAVLHYNWSYHNILEEKELLILYSQYEGYWWPGDTRSIDLIILEYFRFITRRANSKYLICIYIYIYIYIHINIYYLFRTE